MSLIRSVIIFALLTLIFSEKNYTDVVKQLQSAIQDRNGKYYHSAYNNLAYISDTYGPRMWGSTTLQMVILEVMTMADRQNFDNVHLQRVGEFTKWVRGNQELWLQEPRQAKLSVIGLSGTVSGHVKAEAIVVADWNELEKLGELVKGKIVVYNEKWNGYSYGVDYRKNGAWRAAKYGAVAALIRSVTSESIYSVHAGSQSYNNLYPKIPVGCITVEDAEMFARMQKRGQKIILELNFQSTEVLHSYSNNLIFEIKGTAKPDEILLIGGHIDSWDTGSQTGANDDGGGFLTCFEAMRLLLGNGLRPQRTIRFIAWTGQEFGGGTNPDNGNAAYARSHAAELSKHIVAFQDDLGSTRLLGFGYTGNAAGKVIIEKIAKDYLTIINASLVTDDGEAADTALLQQKGVPVMKNEIKDNSTHDFYFKYHHSAGDSMTMMNADDLDSNVLGVAAMFYILADLEQTIPRDTAVQTEFHLRHD